MDLVVSELAQYDVVVGALPETKICCGTSIVLTFGREDKDAFFPGT